MQTNQLFIRDFMTTPVITITPSMTLAMAYDLMADREIRRLPVIDAQGELVGLITLSDIQRLVPLSNQAKDVPAHLMLEAGKVSDIMATDIATVIPDDKLQVASDLMIERKISGLPVVEQNRPIGMITESDIFKVVFENLLLNRFLG